MATGKLYRDFQAPTPRHPWLPTQVTKGTPHAGAGGISEISDKPEKVLSPCVGGVYANFGENLRMRSDLLISGKHGGDRSINTRAHPLLSGTLKKSLIPRPRGESRRPPPHNSATPLLPRGAGERDGMTQGRRGGVRQGNGPKKTGGTEILKPVHVAAPYAFRGRFRGRGGATSRVSFPVISQTCTRGEQQRLPAVPAARVGTTPLPFSSPLPLAVFNEVTQTFGPCVKNV